MTWKACRVLVLAPKLCTAPPGSARAFLAAGQGRPHRVRNGHRPTQREQTHARSHDGERCGVRGESPTPLPLHSCAVVQTQGSGSAEPAGKTSRSRSVAPARRRSPARLLESPWPRTASSLTTPRRRRCTRTRSCSSPSSTTSCGALRALLASSVRRPLAAANPGPLPRAASRPRSSRRARISRPGRGIRTTRRLGRRERGVPRVCCASFPGRFDHFAAFPPADLQTWAPSTGSAWSAGVACVFHRGRSPRCPPCCAVRRAAAGPLDLGCAARDQLHPGDALCQGHRYRP